MDCRDIRSYVDLFIDAELELRDRVDVEKHLEMCGNCQRFVRRESDLRVSLKAKLAPPTAPSHLRANILDAIRNEPVVQPASLADRLRVAFSWAVPAALTTAIALLVVWPFGEEGGSPITASAMVGTDVGSPRAPVPASPLHRAVTLASYQGLGADVQGPDEAGIRSYFESRVPFVVSLPLIPSGDLRLVGAREVSFDEKAGALLIYRMGALRISIIQTAASELDARSPELVVARDGAMTTGRFVRDERLNTVISDVDPATLARVIEGSR